MVDKCSLILQIHNAENFRDIFGSGVTAAARNDITEGFKIIADTLLDRYHVESDVMSPSFGIWYIVFSIKPSDLPIDTAEQFQSLTRVGQLMIRSLFLENFGASTGVHIDFKLAIMHMPEKSLTTDALDHMKRVLSIYPVTGKPCAAISREEFTRIAERADIDTYLLPIIALPDETIAGYEVLSRGPENSPVRDAADLFGTAEHFGMTEELERICISKALDHCVKLPHPYWLSMNIGPELIANPDFYGFVNQYKYKNIFPRLILELTEHIPIQTSQTLQKAIHRLADLGIHLALDDTGCGFAHLGTVQMLRPRIVKLCMTVTRRITGHPDIQRDVRTIVDRISGLGGYVLGEGVEQREQADIMKKSGVSFLQGYYYSPPQHVKAVLNG